MNDERRMLRHAWFVNPRIIAQTGGLPKFSNGRKRLDRLRANKARTFVLLIVLHRCEPSLLIVSFFNPCRYGTQQYHLNPRALNIS